MKLQRWKIRLGEYDFEIKYLEGRQNYVANAFSRNKITMAVTKQQHIALKKIIKI